MTAVVVGLVGALATVCALYWRTASLSREREKTAAEKEQKDAALQACVSFRQTAERLQVKVDEAVAQDVERLRQIESLERKNARLELELQKYESGAKALGRLGEL